MPVGPRRRHLLAKEAPVLYPERRHHSVPKRRPLLHLLAQAAFLHLDLASEAFVVRDVDGDDDVTSLVDQTDHDHVDACKGTGSRRGGGCRDGMSCCYHRVGRNSATGFVSDWGYGERSIRTGACASLPVESDTGG